MSGTNYGIKDGMECSFDGEWVFSGPSEAARIKFQNKLEKSLKDQGFKHSIFGHKFLAPGVKISIKRRKRDLIVGINSEACLDNYHYAKILADKIEKDVNPRERNYGGLIVSERKGDVKEIYESEDDPEYGTNQ